MPVGIRSQCERMYSARAAFDEPRPLAPGTARRTRRSIMTLVADTGPHVVIFSRTSPGTGVSNS